jgi:signal transduction histidine kinase
MVIGTRGLVSAAALPVVAAGTLLDVTVDRGRIESGPAPVLLTALIALAIGAWCPPAVALAAGLSSAVLLTWANQAHASDSYSFSNDLAFFGLVVAGPMVLGALWHARAARVRELRRLTGIRLAQRDVELRLARAEEQARISHAVHQDLVHELGGLVLQATGAARTPDPIRSRDALDVIETSARQALDRLRDHVGSLRTSTSPLATPADAATSGAVDRPPGRRARVDVTFADTALAAASGVALATECVLGSASSGPAPANVLASLVVCGPLAFRRRFPLSVVVAVTLTAAAMSAVLTPVPDTVTGLLPFVLLAYTIGAHTHTWRALVAGCLLLAIGTAAVAVCGGAVEDGSLIPTLLWAGLGVAGGRIVLDRERQAARLAGLLAELETGREAAVRLAVVEQRQVLAGHLHDSVAHAMTVVCLHAVAGRRATGDEGVREALAVIEDAARRGLSELRTGIDALESGDRLSTDVAEIVEEARRTGLLVDASGLDLVEDRPEAELAARVLREGLVTAARHAPGARVEVDVREIRDGLVIEVVDHGAAVDSVAVTGTGHGLALLADRVRLGRGRLSYGPTADGGFRVSATLSALLAGAGA